MTSWVVVGAGAAGCAVAAELASRHAGDVLVLETGPDHPPADHDHGPLVDRTERLRFERLRRRPGKPVESYEQGWGVGGSSLVNAGLLDGAPPQGIPSEPVARVGAVGRALRGATPAAVPANVVRRAGRRVTAADALLRPLLTRQSRVELRTGVRVHRVRFAGRRAIGVETIEGEFVAADHVVLCAGAIRSPAILLRSGVDTPGVGAGAQDHPTAVLTLRLSSPADPAGPIVSSLARFDDSHVVALERLPGDERHGALVTALLDVRSRGQVSLDHDGAPFVELHQFDDRTDLERLARAASKTIGWVTSGRFDAVADAVAIDDRGTSLDMIASTFSRIEQWLLERPTGHRHIAATCPDGVVTDGGVLRGYERLAIADASIFASVPPANPYALVIEQARRVAARLAVAAG